MLMQAHQLKRFMIAVLSELGLTPEDGGIVADSLVGANLRGVDSHGVTRLSIYAKRLELGAINPRPDIKVIAESDATLLVDGGNGMGQVVGYRAMELGIAKAKRHGAVDVAVRNSNHFGTGAFFLQQAVAHDLIAYAMSNAPSTMAPWGGLQPYLGTNPYAFGVPAGQYAPILVDMATSVVARGKIITASKEGKDIPEGWAIDKEGRPTTNAEAALAGSVLPFAGPKGYAIAMMVDLMSGVLGGAGFGSHVNNIYGDYDKTQNVGHYFHLTDISRFMPVELFKQRVDQMIGEMKHSPKAAGVEEIFVPGEIENRIEERRLREGIPLSAEVYDDLQRTGAQFGVDIASFCG